MARMIVMTGARVAALCAVAVWLPAEKSYSAIKEAVSRSPVCARNIEAKKYVGNPLVRCRYVLTTASTNGA